jgi:TonB family protein
MHREAHIPLFLWIATALLVHLGGYGGTDRAARWVGQTLDIRRFAKEVRLEVQQTTSVEVALLDEAAEIRERPAEPATDEDTRTNEEEPEEASPTQRPKKPDREPHEDQIARETDPPAAKPPDAVEPDRTEREKRAEVKASEPEKKEDPKKKEEKVEPPPELVLRNRIAVVQHAEKNQEDNPDAEFLADEANRVEEQTQATLRSYDENTPEPTPGTHLSGPPDAPGNSEQTRTGHSESSPGNPNEAPGNQHQGAESAAASAAPRGGSTPERGWEPAQTAEKGRQAQAARDARAEQSTAPRTLDGEHGAFTIPAERQAQTAAAAQRAQKSRRRRPAKPGRSMDFLGLGANGTTRNGVNLNLTAQSALAIVGKDQLMRERVADGERRRSEHRGSFKTAGIERWRSAIENYVPSVKLGNQTALNTAQAPFATYLNRIHNRLHPIFADHFLGSLDRLPNSDPMNNQEISTNLEIVLSEEDGRVVRMGVTKTSGVTAFDIAALESVQRASPFGAAPKEIVSPDGNVYLHWEFHRLPMYACSTYFAKPYILKVKPKSAPPKVDPPDKDWPFPGEERPPAADERRGQLPRRGGAPFKSAMR